jgi:hypothetical protein
VNLRDFEFDIIKTSRPVSGTQNVPAAIDRGDRLEYVITFINKDALPANGR